MWIVARLASRRPNYEQGNAIDHSNTLKAPLSIRAPVVFAREEISVKKRGKIDEVNFVFLQIGLALGFVPGDHVGDCICGCIYAASR